MTSKKCDNKVNMADIARVAGTSVMTVSRALSDGKCGEQTRKRIRDIADKMGYFPNKLVKAFANERIDTIGIVVPNIIHAFFPCVVNAIEEVLAVNGYNVFLCCSRDNPEVEAEKIRSLLGYRVAGISMLPSVRSTLSAENAKLVLDSGRPLVLVDRIIPSIKCDSVGWRSSEAMGKIIDDLICRKCRNFVYVCGDNNEWRNRGRTKGFFNALKKKALNPLAVLNCEDSESVKLAITELFSKKKTPDAICCATDILADQVLSALKSLGISVPKDVALTGFGGIINNHNSILRITTASQNAEKMGNEAARLILNRLKSSLLRNPKFESVRIPLDVEICESSQFKS